MVDGADIVIQVIHARGMAIAEIRFCSCSRVCIGVIAVEAFSDVVSTLLGDTVFGNAVPRSGGFRFSVPACDKAVIVVVFVGIEDVFGGASAGGVFSAHRIGVHAVNSADSCGREREDIGVCIDVHVGVRVGICVGAAVVSWAGVGHFRNKIFA